MKDSTFITRVALKNYKSIAACDVELGPLMFLVGPNGAGKSNFLDSLRFVADALDSSLDHAIRDRGGIDNIRRRSGGRPKYLSIHLDFDLTRRLHRTLRFPYQCPSTWQVQSSNRGVCPSEHAAAYPRRLLLC